MGILDRMSTILRANINAMLDQAEDPEKTLDQLIRDMADAIGQARGQVAEMIAQEKLLEADMERNNNLAREWHLFLVLVQLIWFTQMVGFYTYLYVSHIRGCCTCCCDMKCVHTCVCHITRAHHTHILNRCSYNSTGMELFLYHVRCFGFIIILGWA